MSSTWSEVDRRHMQRALDLALRGQGSVEPNPMVGCVLVRDGVVIGEGWHQRFGGPHAEIEALQSAGAAAPGSVMYVTLEPCCHFGKTPPCSTAVIAAGIQRVVIAMADPFPKVAGGGIRQLQEAGIEVSVGLLEHHARELNAPYLKLVHEGRPWVIAKWAMSLDGKIATRTGDSRWISNERSRQVVHQIRGRVDGILVGIRTAELDDPLLTARPTGARSATRIVLDSQGRLSSTSLLVQTAAQTPVMVVVSDATSRENRERLERAGCEVLVVEGTSWPERLPAVLNELGRRRMTNLLVEGGAATLGGFCDARLVDEIHVFLAPKLIGGDVAPSPVTGSGIERMCEALQLISPQSEFLDGDVHISGRLPR